MRRTSYKGRALCAQNVQLGLAEEENVSKVVDKCTGAGYVLLTFAFL